jgi:hypothetical protein
MALGHAADTAVALAGATGTTPRELPVAALQAALERDGAILHQDQALERAVEGPG